jgi:hypothetical protein
MGPPRSGGTVRGPCQSLKDLQANAFGVFQHLIVPETQHAKALLFEIHCPSLVVGNIDAMLPAIDLNDEAMPEADKIYNVVIDRLLAAEFVAREMPHSEKAP